MCVEILFEIAPKLYNLIRLRIYIQGVSGEIVNILGVGSTDYPSK